MKVNEFTDARVSEVFVDEMLNGSYYWVEGLNWLKWTGKRWGHVHQSEVKEQARQWVITKHEQAIKDYAKALANDDLAAAQDYEAIVAHWESYSNASRLASLVSLAIGMLLKPLEDFDSATYLLNCQNCVVDLISGDTWEHDRSQLFTKVTNVDYVPSARHIDWDNALEAVPNDIRSWYQLRMGQAITGDMTPDDRIIIQQGYGGENGKSTIMSAIQMTLGDYYLQVAPRALLGSAESVPTEIKALQGIRFACLEELPEEHFLPTTKIKTLAGTPHIKARGMRKDDDGFYASHSLFLNTNFPPAIAESDGGTWRRLCLVNFPYHYVKTADDIRTEFDRLGDPSIRERLRSGKAQREAVLAWLVEGANRYYVDTEGFRTLPQLVVDTTAAWRLTTDMVLGFADEFLTFDDPESYVLVTELLERFNYWIETNNQHKWSAKTFKVRFGGHEVIAANGVEAVTVRRARLTAHISRPEYKQFDQLPDSASFKVWSGVAFKVAEKV